MSLSEMRNPKSETPGAARQVLSRRELRAHPVVRNYMVFCLAALFLLVVCLAERDLDWLCLVPSGIGCLTLVAGWELGPPLVLLSLTVLLSALGPRVRWPRTSWTQFQQPTLMDLILCLAVVSYIIGHYRILALTSSIFPPDPRRSSSRPAPNPLRRRSPELVNGWEMPLLAFAVPLWLGFAVLVWAWVTRNFIWEALPLGIPLLLWQLLQIVWVSLAVLATAGIAASYRRWTTATPEECLLFLQDQCWRQTRREQSILNRWLMWMRLRIQRKKEAL